MGWSGAVPALNPLLLRDERHSVLEGTFAVRVRAHEGRGRPV
jgi:hypothetical protein